MLHLLVTLAIIALVAYLAWRFLFSRLVARA